MRVIFLGCTFLLFFSIQAQTDTAFVSSSTANMVAAYRNLMHDQYAALTGYVYAELRTLKNDHPYFPSDQWIAGSIEYGGQYIDDIPLRFDAVSQTLVSQLKNETMIALVSEKLKSFKIGERYFEWFDKQKFGSLPESGFYEILYNGPTKLICLRKKEAQKIMVTHVYTTVDNSADKLYYDKYKYYILSNGQFGPVSGKSSILGLFSNSKKELKRFSRQHHLDFKSRRDQSLSAILAYYDSLKK